MRDQQVAWRASSSSNSPEHARETTPFRAELERYFFLDVADRGKVQAERRAHSRLGARRAAEDADRAACSDAVSEYAALGWDGLREVARVTSGRG
ncbi:hypothetical protein ACFRFL_15975 [Streptomyces sp. NPDC056708]|uniref:hypothetical protein n=1 Tax=unclassified Streptomyces TaxID=2593676 RepID=UPI003696F8D4